VLRNAGTVDGRHVVIHGAGMLGLTACAMAAAGAAAHIIVLEPDPDRRKLALEFGATHAFDSSLPAAATTAQILKLCDGRGADMALEFSGIPAAVEHALELLRPGGHLVMAGAVFPARPVQWSAEHTVRRLLRITGVYNYAPEDLETALNFLAEHHHCFPFQFLIGNSYSLTDVNAAFAHAERDHPPRVAILP
jgi:alcohol dehydrogenase